MARPTKTTNASGMPTYSAIELELERLGGWWPSLAKMGPVFEMLPFTDVVAKECICREGQTDGSVRLAGRLGDGVALGVGTVAFDLFRPGLPDGGVLMGFFGHTRRTLHT